MGDYFKDVSGAVREDRQSRKEAIRGLALKSGLRGKEEASSRLVSAAWGLCLVGAHGPDAGSGPPQSGGGLWGRTVGGHRGGDGDECILAICS